MQGRPASFVRPDAPRRSALSRWGFFVHRRAWLVLVFSGLLLSGSVVAVLQGGRLQTYQTPANTESGRAQALIEQQLPGAADATFLVIFSHPQWSAADPSFEQAVNASLAGVKVDAHVAKVQTYYDGGPAAPALLSRDGHRVAAIVTLNEDLAASRDHYPAVRAKIAPGPLTAQATGTVAIYSDINTILAKDLQRAEIVSLPVSLILLLIVFGTAVAALLPLGVGMLAILGGLAGVFLVSRSVDVSVYAVNIVTLIGLGVAIDYSLFIVSRYREEIAHRGATPDALAATLATAGRATAFSGLTVAIGLSGLSFFRGLYFASIGLAGAIVVGLAVLFALTFLPALLALIGGRVEKGRVPLPHGDPRFWGNLARRVMRRPLLFLLPTLVLLLAAGIPFFQIHMASGGVSDLPDGAESKEGYRLLRTQFPGASTNSITLVVQYPSGDPISPERVASLYDLSRAAARLPDVVRIESPVDLDPAISKESYQQMYASPRDQLAPGAQAVLKADVGKSIATLHVMTGRSTQGDAARQLVTSLRALHAPLGATLLVTGPTAVDLDTLTLVKQDAPLALAYIVVTTYVLLLLQTGSVVLPLKAIVMNFLSIGASFGAMVWIFQEGNLGQILDFSGSPIDPSLPVLLFCIVFGLSMDYEVLLLSRMHEEWDRTGDNTAAVAGGLEKSGRLITSAAAIMVVVFAAFALAQVTIIKAIGLCLALAIFIDATLVRAIVVPATMRLMGRWNWWAPKWVGRLYRAFG